MSNTELIPDNIVQALVDRERLAFTGRLLRGTVHNLSGTVQMVRLPLDLIELRVEDMDAEQLRQKIGASQQGLTKLTAEVSRLSTQSALSQTADPEPLNMNQLVSDLLPLWAADPYFKHQVQTRLSPGEALPLVRLCHADVAFVLNQLIANALESMADNKAVALEIGLERRGDGVAVMITDGGPGPSAAMAAVMFQPFTTNKDGAHDGLGLFLARWVAGRMGGSIEWHAHTPNCVTFVVPTS